MAGDFSDIKNKLIQYKALYDEGILDQDEFTHVKNDAIARMAGAAGEEDIFSILPECKELMDAGVIDQSDYNRVKGSLFGQKPAAPVQPAASVQPAAPVQPSGYVQPVQPVQQVQPIPGPAVYPGTVSGPHPGAAKPKGKGKLIGIIAAAAVILLVAAGAFFLLGKGGGSAKGLPGGVEFGDSRETVMKAAKKLGNDAEETGEQIWVYDVSLYGYKGIVIYDFGSNGGLCHVTYMLPDVNDHSVYESIVSQFRDVYGDETRHKTEGTDEEYIWELTEDRDIRIDYRYGSTVFVNFWDWSIFYDK